MIMTKATRAAKRRTTLKDESTALVRVAEIQPLAVAAPVAAAGISLTITDWRTSFMGITRSILMDMREQAKKQLQNAQNALEDRKKTLQRMGRDHVASKNFEAWRSYAAVAEVIRKRLNMNVSVMVGKSGGYTRYSYDADTDIVAVNAENRKITGEMRIMKASKSASYEIDELTEEFDIPFSPAMNALQDEIERLTKETAEMTATLTAINWQICNIQFNADKFHSALTIAHIRGGLTKPEDVISVLRRCIQNCVNLPDDSPLLQGNDMFQALSAPLTVETSNNGDIPEHHNNHDDGTNEDDGDDIR